jgi:hypothetical protein
MCERAFLVSSADSGGEKVDRGRRIASVLRGNRICSSGYKERKRAHPNMVLVHNQLLESSRIDLLEVGGR